MEGSLSRFNPWCMNPIADKHIGMSYKHGWYMKIDLLSPRLELQSTTLNFFDKLDNIRVDCT